MPLSPSRLVGAAGIVAAVACADSGAPHTPVDRAECSAGTIAVGATREFVLGAGTGCLTDDIWRNYGDTVRAASFTIRLAANQLYAFRAVEKDLAETSKFDITLAVFGPGSDTTLYGWLAASDDNWGGANDLMPGVYFTPQEDGAHAIRVSGYDAKDTNRVVVLTARACPYGPRLVEARTTVTIGPEHCVASRASIPLEPGVDSTRLTAVRIDLGHSARKVIRVVSSDFRPSVFLGGPGPDVWHMSGINTGNVRLYTKARHDTATIHLATKAAGTYTLLVGAADGMRTGTFVVLVDSMPPSMSLVGAGGPAPATGEPALPDLGPAKPRR